MRPDKPYKAVDPIITINNIRNILTDLGVFLIEKDKSEISNFFSCRLIVNGRNEFFKLDKGVNGKGLTPEYSLASAYAEFMERIQNYWIFYDDMQYASIEYIKKINETEFSKTIISNDLVLDFKYDPDEKYIFYDDLNQLQKTICNHIAYFNKSIDLAIKKKEKILFSPFYCVKERCSELLPIDLLLLHTGSNGMCAGNTKEEAILHGICEIFERYVSHIIFKDEITPPTIPTILFKDTKIYDLLSQLEENYNISIMIKDCSLNKGLPVIGLLIVDHDVHSYTFILGADTSPVIALERCFTELLQGRKIEQTLKKIDISNDPFEHSSISRIKCKNIEFIKFVEDGRGKLPNSILSSNFSYSFSGLNHDLNKNDQEDLKYLLKKIDELGFNIYVRDVSFSDFPSFYIYIPGMSEVTFFFNSDDEKMGILKNKIYDDFALLLNLKNHSIEEYVQIAEILEKYSIQTTKLSPYNVNEDNSINRHYLLALIYYRISNYSKSYENLSKVIDSLDDEQQQQNISLLCSRDYIYYKEKGFNNDEIAASLQNIYKTELLSEVIRDLENEADAFQYHNFPTCFNCEDCEIKNDCYYFDVIKLVKNIQEKHKKNRINQDNLKWISKLF